MPDSPAIEIVDLRKRFRGVEAVRGISLRVERGEFFGLLGPNGAGKSTTLGILTGLVRRDSGRADVLGLDVERDYRVVRRRIGLAPQEFNFDRFLPIEDVLMYQGGYFGLDRRRAKQRAGELLEEFGLSAKRRETIRSLSGGMKRRLLIAKALVHEPEIIILDEPTAGVDVELRHQLWSTLRELNRQGTTVLLTTHYIEEAEALCERVAIIDHGEIVATDSPRSLIAQEGTGAIEITFEEPIDDVPPPLCDWSPLIDGRRLTLHVKDPGRRIGETMAVLQATSRTIQDVSMRQANLEDVFIHLTGHTIDGKASDGPS